MSTKYDPWRQRPRQAAQAMTGVVPPPAQQPVPPPAPAPAPPPVETPAPAATPAPEHEHEPAPAADTSSAAVGPLAGLDRDDLVALAQRHGIPTHRVRTATIARQLTAAGITPDTPITP